MRSFQASPVPAGRATAEVSAVVVHVGAVDPDAEGRGSDPPGDRSVPFPDLPEERLQRRSEGQASRNGVRSFRSPGS